MPTSLWVGVIPVTFDRTRRCPRCDSQHVRRSHSAPLAHRMLAAMFLLRFYRCQTCRARYVGFLLSRRAAHLGETNTRTETSVGVDKPS